MPELDITTPYGAFHWPEALFGERIKTDETPHLLET